MDWLRCSGRRSSSEGRKPRGTSLSAKQVLRGHLTDCADAETEGSVLMALTVSAADHLVSRIRASLRRGLLAVSLQIAEVLLKQKV